MAEKKLKKYAVLRYGSHEAVQEDFIEAQGFHVQPDGVLILKVGTEVVGNYASGKWISILFLANLTEPKVSTGVTVNPSEPLTISRPVVTVNEARRPVRGMPPMKQPRRMR